jgi:mycobactin lysine-N-oxygenase
VVVARGFDGHWFERLLGGDVRARLNAARAGDELERRIDANLAVAGLEPPLHLPMLAGLAQGPGFPNLSCLGLLSDRILHRYVPRSAATPQLAERSQRV